MIRTRVFFFSLLILSTYCSNGQAIKYYTFETDSAAYTPLVGGANATNGATWDDPSFALPIGFKFKVFSDSGSVLYADANFNSGSLFSLKNLSNNPSAITLIAPYNGDIRDQSDTLNLSPITYTTTGTVPNRIFKLEYANARFVVDTTSMISFQVWLHEGSNAIETRFGPAIYNAPNLTLYDPEYGPGMVIIDQLSLLTGTVPASYYVRNDPESPTLDSLSGTISGPDAFAGVDDHPDPNRIWRLLPVPNIIYPAELTGKADPYNLALYNDGAEVWIQNNYSDKCTAEIYNTNGQLVNAITINPGKNTLAMPQGPSQVYRVRLRYKNSVQGYSILW
jgi:hypothetical protein